MKFRTERLIELREKEGINKAEAARRLNTTAMAYGRYEKGEREPAYQVVCYIAQVFHTSPEYLYGLTDIPESDSITISRKNDPELFDMVQQFQDHPDTAKRLLAYYQKLCK